MTFFIIFFVLMMNFLWRYIDELTGKGLGADVIIELLFYATINLIPLGMPLVMLLVRNMTLPTPLFFTRIMTLRTSTAATLNGLRLPILAI